MFNRLLIQSRVRSQLDDVVMEYFIHDLNAPLIVTFAPANYFLTPQQANAGKACWGFDFLRKQNFNVLAFNHIGFDNWYRSEGFVSALRELSPLISGFNERIGYGNSKGAFGVTLFADILKIDRAILLAPLSTRNIR